MAQRKDRMALLSRYAKLHNARYGTRPDLNLNVEQWASDMLIESYGLPECYDLLEYYFSVAENPSWKFFANYADKVVQSIKNLKEDKKVRALQRQKAREWLND
jgi:hypothetical protein